MDKKINIYALKQRGRAYIAQVAFPGSHSRIVAEEVIKDFAAYVAEKQLSEKIKENASTT